MQITGCPVRTNRVVWKNIDGEVVIADMKGSTVRILNKTASLIWILADGTKKVEDMVPEVCDEFEVTPKQAQADVMEFLKELLQAGLISMKEGSHEA